MARSEGGASPKWAVTTERRRQLPFCFGPLTVALILAAACVARLAEIAADIGTAFRALANAKIHSNATHSSIQQSPRANTTQTYSESSLKSDWQDCVSRKDPKHTKLKEI